MIFASLNVNFLLLFLPIYIDKNRVMMHNYYVIKMMFGGVAHGEQE